MLIERSADVTAKDREGKTPLLLASRAEIASVLIERGADLTTQDRYGEASGVARETTGSRWCTYGPVMERGADVNLASLHLTRRREFSTFSTEQSSFHTVRDLAALICPHLALCCQ